MIQVLPKDIEQTPIQGAISGIPKVQNLSTVSGSWYSVDLEYECKQLILQPRHEVDWLFATTSGGDYFTARNGAALEAPVVAASGTTIGWVSCNTSTTFELLIGR